jgi:hypothetical protein
VARMATIKVFSLGGLDKKSNDLIRPPEKSSKMLNMEYDVKSQLRKRTGFDAQLIDGILGLNPDPNLVLRDVLYYSNKNEFLFFYQLIDVTIATLIHVYVVTKDSLNNFSTRNTYQFSGAFGTSYIDMFPVSSEENSLSLYFSCKPSLSSKFKILKYDGSFVVSAGLMVPQHGYYTENSAINYPSGVVGRIINEVIPALFAGVFTGTVNAISGYYVRIIPKYTDFNGIVTYGPYLQSERSWSSGSYIHLSSSHFQSLNTYRKYLRTTASASPYLLNSSNRTLNSSDTPLYVSDGGPFYHHLYGKNYIAGDKVLILGTSTLFTITSPAAESVILIVESVTNTTITFTAASLSGVSISFTGPSVNIDRRCEFIIAISSTPDTGYYITQSAKKDDKDLYVADGSLFPGDPLYVQYIWTDIGLSTNSLVPLEDIYDSTTLKTPPPICSYLASYGDQLVYGGIIGVYDLNNKFIPYRNNDLIMYSDVSTGDSCENVSESNRQRIGETWDGEISGIKRSNDSCMIFKTRGVFALDGVLIQGQYALRKINTNFEGCTSFKSIVQADEGVYYQGHNGIYFTNGISVEKLTAEIDSLYLSGEYKDTVGVRLKKKQKTFFYTPSLIDSSIGNVVVVDYYYGQVYTWDGIVPTSSMIEDKDGDVYYSDGIKFYKSSESLYQDTSNISAYYSTTWHHAGEPSLNKKWLSIRIFALTTDAFTVTVKTEGDWIEGVYLTSNDLTFTASDQTKFIMLDMQTKKSLRVTFSNAVGGENLPITGYEITYEAFNAVDKN